MNVALGLLGVVALIVANGYFVAFEFAFVAVRRPRLEEGAAGGERRSVRALAITKRLSFVLSGAQLGITVCSLATGYIAEPVFARLLEPVFSALGLADSTARAISFTTGFVVATAGQMVFGELAPKNLAIARPEPFALALAGSVTWYTRLASPFIWLFDGAATGLLKLVGVQPIEELAGTVTADELDFIVVESARQGSLTPRQGQLLARALEFPERTAIEVMVPRRSVATLPDTATGGDLRRRLRTPFTRFPVTSGDGDLDDVVGVAHAEDLLALPVAERDAVAVTAIMRPPLYVPESSPVTAVLDRLRATDNEMAVVVDEYGGVAGVLTMEDLAEELVGDITDEHDAAATEVVAVGESSWRLPGTWRIDEVERDTGIALPDDEDYDTVGGLVMARLGRLAAVGDIVDAGPATLEVLDVRRRQVVAVRMTATPAEAVE
jgi:CBS domain containing-hemolysin-like protein